MLIYNGRWRLNLRENKNCSCFYRIDMAKKYSFQLTERLRKERNWHYKTETMVFGLKVIQKIKISLYHLLRQLLLEISRRKANGMQHELIRLLMIKMSPKLFWLLFSLSVLLIFLPKKSIYADESQTSLKSFVIIWQIWSFFIKNFAWTHFGEDPKIHAKHYPNKVCL